MRSFSIVLVACLVASWNWYEVGAFDLDTVNAKLFYPNKDHKRSQHKYAILHMTNNVWFFQELSNITLENKRRYARKYNVEMVVHTPYETMGLLEKTKECNETDDYLVRVGSTCYSKLSKDFEIDSKRAPTFGKLKLLLHACVGRADYWLLWTDADALIVNHTIPLGRVVDDRYNLMFTEDWFMLNAGVFLMKCSSWTAMFLRDVYMDRSFDEAVALDQSALQYHINQLPPEEKEKNLKILPKHIINVYTEEYIPGDFIVHMAGKLYEATTPGTVAIARQFDLFSFQEDVENIRAFFSTRYLLNYYTGYCKVTEETYSKECKHPDDRRLMMKQSLGDCSKESRYWHTVWRDKNRDAPWTDKHDVPGWDEHTRNSLLQRAYEEEQRLEREAKEL
uniref:Nucleotide-diphospho-sugar transferase domain-containing protein n=3 Tax=Rhodosorus marinus TaxID=101924 RepID=A0A7S3A506_9RHOD|mmetsp:Transcript_41504/g.163340  ORF Transcript_41504/g.163340 Transcript_41504/m.163340 type:complete len:393 (+) Transcript_41504:272-1450(+)|eukprot:CAMPEP_0113965586 /NCGR_PEP_ID=MMETSP0011_2-20120614/7828_1 /TAXON_ID=101924 /ORGANISM="Rhodosorus marinus" /LENGTH=392 /DNA_ID=CAMNT_0000978117 /DNA_START=167 /DNA_END=1345 /DNA_ORIENTATION=- /assembly_acc=CAM_ASM_000156